LVLLLLLLQAWIEAQKEFAGVDASKRNVWIQVGSDKCAAGAAAAVVAAAMCVAL
jgi:predicted S18 family serine protease